MHCSPTLLLRYWYLADDATMRDVLLAVRADEGNHRDVNHILANTKAHSASPFQEPTFKEYK